MTPEEKQELIEAAIEIFKERVAEEIRSGMNDWDWSYIQDVQKTPAPTLEEVNSRLGIEPS